MSIGSALLGLALLGLVGLFIAHPLLQGRREQSRQLTKREALLAQKDAIYDQIKSLDFDYSTGKIPEDVHRELRAHYMAEAVETVKELDALDGLASDGAPFDGGVEPMDGEAKPEGGLDAEMEAAIMALRQPVKEAKPAVTSSTVEELSSEATPQEIYQPIGGANGTTKFCPQCGQKTDPDDKFCAHCGHQFRQSQRV